MMKVQNNNSKIYNIRQTNNTLPLKPFFQAQRDRVEFTMPKTIDIKLKGIYPANVLSNLSDTNFKFEGVQINSIEGFLQSLKVKDPEKQKEICALSGLEAKKMSKGFVRLSDDIKYHWAGESFAKGSKKYHEIVDLANQKRKEANGESFEMDGVEVKSVMGLLQAMKVEDLEKQKELCLLDTDEAKKIAKDVKKEYEDRTLYWQGKSFKRGSLEYQKLLSKIYKTRYVEDERFRNAIIYSKNCKLTHRVGKEDKGETILTSGEFISHLEQLREDKLLNVKAKLFNMVKK